MTLEERTWAALSRLAELGPVGELIAHAPVEAAEAAGLDRVLLSRVDDGELVAETLYFPGGDDAALLARLRETPARLAYPLVEAELLRRRRAQLIADIDRSHPGRYAFLDVLGWRSYVAAPVLVEGRAVAFLHGDRGALTEDDAAALERFATGLGLIVERSVLRSRLRAQQREIRRVATWAERRIAELGDARIDLSIERAEPEERDTSAPAGAAGLTAREHDVLKLMTTGKTNHEIARALVVTEGTVKFHVKNVLRKLQASNRADAASRYLRLTLDSRR